MSGTRKGPKPKLLGFPRDGVGAEKFGMSLKTRETNLFWWDIPGFCRDVPEVPEELEKRGLCSIFVPCYGQHCQSGVEANASSWGAI